MRFLADESCDFAVVVALRTAGHDVKAVVEQHRLPQTTCSWHSLVAKDESC